jgi:uncharacterized damage-inducible protein DinB
MARKDRLIAELIETRRKVIAAASALSPAQQDEVFLGVWSVKDLLAHLVGWDYANLEAVQALLAGELPAFYAHHGRDWRHFNALLVAEHKKDDFAELCASLEASQHKLVDFVETIPPEEFDRDRGVRFKGYKVTIARMLEGQTGDDQVHLEQIEAFRARDDQPAPP